MGEWGVGRKEEGRARVRVELGTKSQEGLVLVEAGKKERLLEQEGGTMTTLVTQHCAGVDMLQSCAPCPALASVPSVP